MAENQKKLVLMVTHGPENSELSTIPFVMAVTAQASDVDVLMGFQGNGVMLAVKGMADHVVASGFPPLKDLLKPTSRPAARCTCAVHVPGRV
jgi:predicted peroxiredoxin